MSGPLILTTMLIYFFVAGEQLARGNVPGFIIWGAYGVANIGFYMMAK